MRADPSTHICDHDCPPVGVAGAVPTSQRMPEIRVIPEHYFDVAAEAWASVQGDQIDALDDQLRASVTAVVRLDNSTTTQLAHVRTYAPGDVTEVRDGHKHLIGYHVNDARQRELSALIGECPECGCCKGCPGGDGHCEDDCHPAPEYLYGFIAGRNGEFVHHGDEGQARAVARIVHQPVMRRQVWYGEIEPADEVVTDG